MEEGKEGLVDEPFYSHSRVAYSRLFFMGGRVSSSSSSGGSSRAQARATVNERLRVMKMSVRGDVERAAWKG